jgi:signal transduction histidine kinase
MFLPDPTPLPEAPSELYRAAEAMEDSAADVAGAAELYRQLTVTKQPAVRAGAWARLARTLRKAGDDRGALAAYTELSRIENVAAVGWPATLAAAWGRCTVLQELGRDVDLRQSAQWLRQQLAEGKWQVAREVYGIFAEDVERWTGQKRPLESEALTDAANGIWERVQRGEEAGDGHRLVAAGAERITVLWKTTGRRTAILAASHLFAERSWLKQIGEPVWLRDESGRDLSGAESGDVILRYPSETHLPWTVAVAATAGPDEFAARRQLLLVLLAVVGLFTVAGGYFCVRSLRREFALARMQSDFVAAVSHEFRTPLTSMRLITEALEDGRIPDPVRLGDSYHALARATGRLQRLVDDLLDFRRMESGAVEYRMKVVDAADAVRNVVEEFRKEVEDRGFRLHVHVDGVVRIQADERALSRALWNLLDNAAKYSGDSHDIDVGLEYDGTRVAVSVKDRGIGIPPEERAQLFDRFYRAENAKRAGIQGTGIGLTMVAQIAAAHGGKISVMSELGRGSTFTMSLPVEQA